jgi:membrane protease YdiL (CAAX protease family)
MAPHTPLALAVPLYGLDIVASIAIVTLIGCMGEEIGWRGYLLPHLMSLGLYPALLLSLAHSLFDLRSRA